MSPKTAWNRKKVAHGPQNDYPHLPFRDTPWWVDKRGIFVLFRSTVVFQKFRENCTRCRPLQIHVWRTIVRRVSTQELRSWEEQKQARSSFLCICMEGISKSFNPKTRFFPLNLNSQQVFTNQQYFMASKSNFGAFFQDTFFLCGINTNHLKFKLWLVEMFFFSRT